MKSANNFPLLTRLLLSVLFFLTWSGVLANDTTTNAEQSVFVELGGAAGLGSLNYERSIYKHNSWRLMAGVGLGTFKVVDFENKLNPDVLIPIGLTVLKGKKRHHFLLGGGTTIASMVMVKSDGKGRAFQNHYFGKIGYRYQLLKSKLYFQMSYVPIFEQKRNLRNWAGCSVGISF